MKRIYILLLTVICLAACKKDAAATKTPIAASLNTSSKKSLPGVTTLSFSGYTWYVSAPAGQVAPGPNYWNAANAWVDASGYLHLKAAYNATTGHWECAEVYTSQSLGYGTYQWQVEANLGALDKNIVFGMFNYSGNSGYDEMDIEIARWGNSAWPNLNYTIWPATGVTASPGVYTDSFTTPNGTYTTHRFKRTATSVKLQSLYGFQSGDTNQFDTATFTSPGTSISTLAMPVHMSLWLYGGSAPTNGQNVEIIIHNFTFTAL